MTDLYKTINGCSIRYRKTGKGPLLFLVHGIAGFLEEWNPSLPCLSEKYCVVALDLPGHGLSGKPDIAYTIDALTDFLKDFITSFSSEAVFLAGHSLGGAICLNLVIHCPNMVKRLILANSAFEKLPLSIRLGTFRVIPQLVKEIPKWMVMQASRKSVYNNEFIVREHFDYAHRYINIPGNLKAMFSIIQSNVRLSGLDKNQLEDYREKVKKIPIPVLILYGDKDRVIPNVNSKRLHETLGNSKCIAVENCGHGLYYEKNEVFCREVLNFLTNP